MEQHPVPQNVTTFQFRLIGDMTIKQFGYLAGGLILAYISYKLPLPFFITWPLALFTGLMGIGFAFVPIEERPMDVWVLSFIKSAYSPTQYVWQKTAPAQPVLKSQVNKTAPANQDAQTISPVQQLFTVRPPVQPQRSQTILKAQSGDIKKPGFFDAILSLFVTIKKIPVDESILSQTDIHAVSSQSVPSVAGTHTFTTVPLSTVTNGTNGPVQSPASGAVQPEVLTTTSLGVSQKEDEHLKKTEELEAQVRTLEQELHTKALSDSRIMELQKQLTDLLTSKQSLEKELIELRRQVVAKPVLPPQQPLRMAGMSQGVTPKSTVNVISANNTARAGIPRLTSIPNVVSGLAKDGEGNLLPGVLVTVRDQNDVPLRALKTNKLGQFAASTPLPNGTYVLEVEDTRQRFLFDRAQITLTGALVPPLEIIAKSQKELTRQKLTQELFGNQAI